MIVINGLALGAFAVPRSDTADRMSVSMTMVLTAVAFKLQIADSLPDLSYLTLLDGWVLASFLFIAAVAVENIFAESHLADEEDELCRDIFVGVYCAGNALLALLVLWNSKYFRKSRYRLKNGKLAKVHPDGADAAESKCLEANDNTAEDGIKPE